MLPVEGLYGLIETRQTIRVHGRVVSKTLSIDRPPLWPVLGIDRLPSSKRPGSGRYTTSSAVVTPLHIVLGGYRLINYHNDANAYFYFGWLCRLGIYLTSIDFTLQCIQRTTENTLHRIFIFLSF